MNYGCERAILKKRGKRMEDSEKEIVEGEENGERFSLSVPGMLISALFIVSVCLMLAGMCWGVA